MVIAALEQVARTVAEVVVESDTAAGKIKVAVGEDSRDFDISSVKSIFDTYRVLREAMAFIRNHLVAHKNKKEVEYAAVNGMLQTLDAHSVLLEPRAYQEMKVRPRGELGAVGLVVAMRDGNLTVVRVLKNGPAQRGGIRPRDTITEIDEQSTVNMDVQDAVDRLRGAPGTEVAITVVRAGNQLWRLALKREALHVESVPEAKLLEHGVAYVRVSGSPPAPGATWRRQSAR
jgi:carboxyl-terminal processing protease